MNHSFRIAHHVEEVNVRCLGSLHATFRTVRQSYFLSMFLIVLSIFLNCSAMQQLGSLVRSFIVMLNASCCYCWARLCEETSDISSGLVVVNAERAIDVIGGRRLPTFRTGTGDGTAYFNEVPWDIQRVYL